MTRRIVRTGLIGFMALFASIAVHQEGDAQLRLFRRRCTVYRSCCPCPCYAPSPCYAPAPSPAPAPCPPCSKPSSGDLALTTSMSICPLFKMGPLPGSSPQLFLYYAGQWTSGMPCTCGMNPQPLYLEDDLSGLSCPQVDPATTSNDFCITSTFGTTSKKDKGCQKGHDLKAADFPPKIGEGKAEEVLTGSYKLSNGHVAKIRFYEITWNIDGNDLSLNLGYEDPTATANPRNENIVCCADGNKAFNVTVMGNNYRVLLARKEKDSICP